jgi:hypothetical protein
MVGWLARGLLFVAAVVTSWFIAEDAPTFGGMRMAVGLLLLVLVVSVVTHTLARRVVALFHATKARTRHVISRGRSVQRRRRPHLLHFISRSRGLFQRDFPALKLLQYKPA